MPEEMLLQVQLQLFLPWEQERLELRELMNSFLTTNQSIIKPAVNHTAGFCCYKD